MKRLWFNIVIFFGCFLLLITVLGAVLVMAPGMELLGVMYIRSTSGSADTAKTVTDAAKNKQILIESNNIPVYIQFVQSYDVTARLTEEYDGFAKASDAPSVNIYHRGDTIAIESHEYIPFLAHSRSDESALVIKVPIYYSNNISVVSRKSDIQFCGLGTSVNDIYVETAGSVQFESDLQMHALKLSIKNKDAIISNNVVMNGSILATSNGGNLTIPSGFAGRVEYVSNSGDLLLSKCAQLSFKSSTGALKGVGEDLPLILGDANINTGGKVQVGRIEGAGIITAGNQSVTIGKEDETYNSRLEIYTILGDVELIGTFTNVESKVKTKYGDIHIKNIENANIVSQSGDVEIYHTFAEGNITTKSGKVKIQQVTGLVNIETKSGNVSIGSDKALEGSANITTKSGKITILNAGDGVFALTTTSGNVEFSQDVNYRAKLTVNAVKSNVKLNDLTGETNVETSKKITAYVHNINEPINLTGKNKRVEVHVKKIFYVDLESNKTIESAPGLTEEVKEYRNAPASETKQIITIKTQKGKIAVVVD